MILLSILIPTTPDRKEVLYSLLSSLHSQIEEGNYQHNIEILVEEDNRECSVGAKRQKLLERAKGDYVVYIDDDDKVSSDYIHEIREAINKNPDVVTFDGWVETNGTNREYFKISKHFPYITVTDVYGKNQYLRYPNHICVIKRKIALEIGYRDMKFAEDFDFATRLRESGLLQNEVYIQKDLYFYLYNSKK